METNQELAVIILAAGLGKRMKSKLAKVLHPIMDLPMIRYTVDAAAALKPARLVVVIGHQAEQVKQALENTSAEFAYQPNQAGTGDAVRCTRSLLGNFQGRIIILPGDAPAISTQTLENLLRQAQKYQATLLTTCLDNPFGYGRVLRNGAGLVEAIIEERDASAEQRQIKEINTGFYCFQAKTLFTTLDSLTPNNAQGEYYLTDVIGILHRQGIPLQACIAENPQEVLGINDRAQLAEVGQLIRHRILREWMLSGVTVHDPATTFIGRRVTIGADTVIKPFTTIEGGCRIGEGCTIGPNVSLLNANIANGVTVRQGCVIQDSSVADAAIIGPYSHIRPGSLVEAGAHVGNFVELKKTTLGPGSKANHLTYLGDAAVGRGVNIGAGTITCNYDGVNKHQTVIEDGVFIGSNSALVAPVRIGQGAYVGAGSTITENVPAYALALGRIRQMLKLDWAKNRRKNG